MPEAPLDESRLARALAGRRVLLTGHTGFKGGWLALWLNRLGAETTGVALAPDNSGPSLFSALRVDGLLRHRVADVRSEDSFLAAVADVDAEIVIHMAAQSLVRPSYAAPVETFHTNVVGTAVVLEAARRMPSLRAVIVVTSDKCYENEEWAWGYRENDRLGGADPYSASKGCAEIVTAAYARSSLPGVRGRGIRHGGAAVPAERFCAVLDLSWLSLQGVTARKCALRTLGTNEQRTTRIGG